MSSPYIVVNHETNSLVKLTLANLLTNNTLHGSNQILRSV